MSIKAVFFSDIRNFIQMTKQYLVTVRIAVQIEIFAQANHMRFVHTDIDFARRKRLWQRRKHFIDKFVRFIGVNKQYVVYVDDIGKRRKFY